MKILFTRFPLESAYGGAEVQTLSLMRGLIQKGHAVAFLGSCPTLLRLCREEGIPATELDIGPPPVTKRGAISFAWRAKKMRTALTQAFDGFHDLDAVCLLSLSEKLLLTEHAANAGTKVVWVEHDTVGRWLTGNPWLADLLHASQHATIVTVSELSRKLYLDMDFDATRVKAIPNGIEEERFSERTAVEHTGPLRIGCVARLSREKGIDLLIEAVSALPDVTLEIIGEGSDERVLRALAKNAGNRITFSPPTGDIASAYARFDVLALPSRAHDPFGMVAAEAMMSGVPVIVTDACGIAAYLQNGEDAIVVRADFAPALRDAIASMQHDATRTKIAAKGYATSRRKFSAVSMVNAWEEMLRSES